MVLRSLRGGAGCPRRRTVGPFLSSMGLALLPATWLLTAGCGAPETSGSDPDPEPASACEVVATTPSFGAGDVDAHTALTITYSQPINGAGLAGKVSLSRLGGEPVDVTVAPEGDASIVVTPVHDLRLWDDYALTVSDGVATADGEGTCPPVQLAFATLAPVEAPHPLRPTQVSSGAMVDATHLLVASLSGRSLQVYDVADPAHPVLQSERRMDQTPAGVRVLGDRAYVPSGAWGIPIFDVSDPGNPLPIGVAGTPGQALEVAPFERSGKTYLAVADGAMGVRIVDVTVAEGAKDVWVGQPLVGARSVALEGDLLAVVDSTGWFELYDLADPAHPALLSSTPPAAVPETFNVSIPANDVVLLGDRLVISQSYAGFQSFDISDPASPVFLDHLLGPQGMCPANCPDELLDLHVSGGQVFAASAMTGAVRVALDGAGVLSTSAVLPAPGRNNAVILAGGSLFVGGDAGLGVFDAAAPDQATSLYTEEEGWGVHLGVAVAGSLLHASSSSRGVETYTLADPLAPAVGKLAWSQGVERDYGLLDIDVKDGVVLVADGRAGLSLFDTQDPAAPAALSNLPTTDSAVEILPSADPKYVYACLDNRGVGVFDVSDPSAPVALDIKEEINGAVGGCKDLVLAGDHLYYSGGTGLAVLDASVPDSLALVGTMKLPAEDLVGSLAYSDAYPTRLFGTTFVFDWEGTHDRAQRLLVFDITDPANPVRVYKSEDLGGARSVEARGDKLFLAAGEQGVLVFDATTPDDPFLEGQIPTRGIARRLVFSGPTLYVAEMGGGLGAIHVGELGL